MGVHVAYGNRSAVNSAIDSGVIPSETIIIAKKHEHIAELLYYDHEGNLKFVSTQPDFLVDDPGNPAYIKNKPTSLPIGFIDGLEEALNSKAQINIEAPKGAFLLADGDGNIAASDVTLQSLMAIVNEKTEITDEIIEGALMISDGSGGLKHSEFSTQDIFSSISKKAEISGDIIPGALMIVTEDGSLQCSDISYSDIVLKSDIGIGTITSTVTLEQSGVQSIAIPEEVSGYPNIHVYHNGMLLVEQTHYTVSDNYITLVGYSTYAGDLFTFVGYGSAGGLSEHENCHTHTNKPVLDSITQEMVDAWNLSSSSTETFVKKEELFGEDGRIFAELLPSNEPSLELGETSDTAFRGDYGLVAYMHSQEEHAPVNAQENKIESVAVGTTLLPAVNKCVTIPIGDEESLGVVKSSTEINKVFIEPDGTMSVKSIDTTKLIVPEGEELILISGDSST